MGSRAFIRVVETGPPSAVLPQPVTMPCTRPVSWAAHRNHLGPALVVLPLAGQARRVQLQLLARELVAIRELQHRDVVGVPGDHVKLP